MLKIFIQALILIVASFANTAQATTNSHDDANAEAPLINSLLERAVSLETNRNLQDGEWQAANLYCEASRLGSAEGQYRLGMLYAFGFGVPKNRALAASLFATASVQGHEEAQRMLDTIAITDNELPPCVLADVQPEKLIVPVPVKHQSIPTDKQWIVNLVEALSEWYAVDPKLILAIVSVESDFKLQAKSQKSAMGLMQLIPATADRFNVKNVYDASQNIKGGITYIKWLLSYFRGDVRLAVAGYNAGERAVDRHNGIPPYAETRSYVQKVLARYNNKLRHPYDAKITMPSPVLSAKTIEY